MNVLMIVSWYTNYNSEIIREGIFHYEQAIALKKNCNVALWFPFDKSINKKFNSEIEKDILVFRSCFPKGRIAKIFSCIHVFKKIRKEFEPDVIHVHVAQGAGRVGFIVAKIFRLPVIVTEHNPIELMNLKSKKTYFLTKLIYKNSNKNICVSPNLSQRLSEFFPSQKFETICNGVINPETFLESSIVYRQSTKINCCIVAGFYSKEIKGYQFLLPAIKKLVDEGISITLHICGGGEFLNYYKDFAKTLGIEHSCIFYGQCDKKTVYNIINQMDFSISASLFESAGVAAEEAMLLGKPLVVTKSGGTDSLVTDKTAVVVETGSTDALLNGIKSMISRLDEFNPKEIKEYAHENFDIYTVSQKYMKIYKEVVKKGGKL